MPISAEHNCVAFNIPRTGGSSMSRLLGIPETFAVLNKVCLFRFGEGGRFDVVLQTMHLTPMQVLSLGLMDERTLEESFTFCFVRNPWDRVVSDYAHTYHAHCDGFGDYVRKLEGLVTFINGNYTHEMKSPFYREYCRLVMEVIGEREWVDPHFFPQHLFLEDDAGRPTMDFVGRYEHFSRDADRIKERLGITGEIPHLNASKRPPYQEMYDRESRDIVGAIYARDIELLGYRF